MLKPNIKYRVTLAEDERKALQNLVRTGKTAGSTGYATHRSCLRWMKYRRTNHGPMKR